MLPTVRYSLLLFLLAYPLIHAHARDLPAVTRDVAVPAGTLLECTLSEPKFSSATTSVGDPFLCYPRNLQEFGQPVFPRGAYLVGHLEDAKEPGHFVGKGFLKMTMDRIGLPATDIPVRAKVIAVAGYKVDKDGKVIGHGHPTRDVVEWMLPPLWPWKVLTLPAKGPRPTLKGEVRIILRVMDDFVVPQQVAGNLQPERLLPNKPTLRDEKGWRRFGEPAGALQKDSTPAPRAIPVAAYTPAALTASEPETQTAALRTDDEFAQLTTTATSVPSEIAPPVQEKATRSVESWPANVTLFALPDTVIPVQQYWRQGDALVYILTTGDKGSVPLDRVDWSTTARLNWQRGIRVTLHGPGTTETKGE
jgi:hypothetical protein